MIKHLLVASVALTGAAGAKAKADEYGVATYYRNPWHGGLIAAHRTLPFGSHVRVTQSRQRPQHGRHHRRPRPVRPRPHH